MTGDWLAGGRVELAGERILDAVRALVIDKGAGTVGMAEVAETAGCSRATLYRYFATGRRLYVAFAGREATQSSRGSGATGGHGWPVDRYRTPARRNDRDVGRGP